MPHTFLELREQRGHFMPFLGPKTAFSEIFTTVAVLWRCVISSVMVQTTMRNCLMMYVIAPKAAVNDDME